MLPKLKKFVNACLRGSKSLIYSGKIHGYIPREVSAKRKNMKNPLALAKTCDRLAKVCSSYSNNSTVWASCCGEKRGGFDSGGLGKWASFFSSSSG